MSGPAQDKIVEIRDLNLEFPTYRGPVRALRDVSLEVGDGEIVGLVGESGCGKSVTAMALLRLLPEDRYRITAGEIRLLGRDPMALRETELQEMRGASVSMIFQEPMNALNPTIRIGRQLVQVIRRHRTMGAAAAEVEAARLLDDMQIPDARRVMKSYPFELSGGLRQRVLIAIAFSCNPRLLIADEPTTALDVTVQAQILALIQQKARETGSSVLFITHDMAVVSQLCDRTYVMYAGRIVEAGATDTVLHEARHPYTRALLRALPEHGVPKAPLESIPGTVPNLLNPPAGCVFEARCPDTFARCREAPPMAARPGTGDQTVACWLGEGEPS